MTFRQKFGTIILLNKGVLEYVDKRQKKGEPLKEKIIEALKGE